MNPEAYIEMAATENCHWWFRGRRQIIAAKLQRLNLPKPCHILEVGCGTGGNFEMLREFGTISAFDADDTAFELVRQKNTGTDDIRLGKLPGENPFPGKSFDLICLFDVLEHIADDNQALTQLQTSLNDSGYLILTVPAFPWLWSDHDVFLYHKRRYTRTGLVTMLESLGFQVECSTYFNFWLFPITATIRLINRLFRLASRAGTAVPHPIINEFLYKLLVSEKHLLERVGLPFGVSILVIARVCPKR